MKRTLILSLLLVAALASAQVPILFEATPTLEWDAPPTEIWVDLDGDGVGDLADLDGGGVADDPLVEAVLSVEYDVAYSVDPVSDRAMPDQLYGSTQSESLQVVVPANGRATAWAVRTHYTTASGVSTSAWSWSDREEDTDGSPFFYAAPGQLLVPRPRSVRDSP